MAEDDKKVNIFWRQSIYPDAEGIFSFRPKSLSEIKDDCFVVLDTNALLVPFTTGKDSLKQIGNIYRELGRAKRLVVPGQVAREFAEHRVTKLKELYQQISRKKSSIGLGNYPLLDSLEEYKKALELEQNLKDSIRAYNTAVDALLDLIGEWYWNDPVSALYREVFAEGAVQDPVYDEQEVSARLEHDAVHKLPPGYKDAHKKDDGIGDLLIWQTILDVSTKKQKSVIFVSLDQKTDWLSQSEGRALYPRYELVDEFRRSSGGQSFHAVRFSTFLNLYGASEEVVEEVRKEEQQVRPGFFDSGAPLSYEGLMAENAVYDWLKTRFPFSLISKNDRSFPDYEILDQDDRTIGIEIKYFRDAHSSLRRLRELRSQILPLLNSGQFDEFILVLVGISEKAAFSLSNTVDKMNAMPMAKIVIGFLASSGEFIEYPEAPTE